MLVLHHDSSHKFPVLPTRINSMITQHCVSWFSSHSPFSFFFANPASKFQVPTSSTANLNCTQIICSCKTFGANSADIWSKNGHVLIWRQIVGCLKTISQKFLQATQLSRCNWTTNQSSGINLCQDFSWLWIIRLFSTWATIFSTYLIDNGNDDDGNWRIFWWTTMIAS